MCLYVDGAVEFARRVRRWVLVVVEADAKRVGDYLFCPGVFGDPLVEVNVKVAVKAVFVVVAQIASDADGAAGESAKSKVG